MPQSNPTPPRDREEKDAYDRDLLRDSGQAEGGREAGAPDVAQEHFEEGLGGRNFQKDRTGQAQSPVEQNLDQPENHREGHH